MAYAWGNSWDPDKALIHDNYDNYLKFVETPYPFQNNAYETARRSDPYLSKYSYDLKMQEKRHYEWLSREHMKEDRRRREAQNIEKEERALAYQERAAAHEREFRRLKQEYLHTKFQERRMQQGIYVPGKSSSNYSVVPLG